MSTTGFPFFRSRVSEELAAIHRAWALMLGWGVLLIVLGIAALAYPAVATVLSV